MSFLKKLGQILSTGLQIVSNFFPILKPFLGSGHTANQVTEYVNDFTLMGQAALQIETALQGATGAQKLAALVPLIKNIVQTSELVSGHPIANEAEFIASCTDLGNATVRLLNSLASDHINVTGNSKTVVSSIPATPVMAIKPLAETPSNVSVMPTPEPSPEPPTTQGAAHPLALS